MSASDDGGQRGVDLTIWGISDTELLGIVDDLADENGWTRTLDIRLQLGENPEDVGHRSGVGPRMSWMVRYGWLERGDTVRDEATGKHVRLWRLTAMGHAILDNPNLSKTLEAALNKLNPAQRMRMTRELAEYGSVGAAEIKTALRREWQRSLGR